MKSLMKKKVTVSLVTIYTTASFNLMHFGFSACVSNIIIIKLTLMVEITTHCTQGVLYTPVFQ